MVKCIASDMDGTLFNSMEMISEENSRAIKIAQEKGIEVVIATGRSYEEARHALDKAGLNCAVISLNGAVVWDEQGNAVAADPIEEKIFGNICTIIESYNTYYEVYTNKGVFTCSEEQSFNALISTLALALPNVDLKSIKDRVQERFSSDFITKIDNIGRLYEMSDIQFYKVLVFSEKDSTLENIHRGIEMQTDLAVSSSGPGNIEITNKRAQKGEALRRFVEERGISLQETMAIGDSLNDYSMLTQVGHSVAMGNARPDIKELCQEVTLTNDQNGVAEAIKKVLTGMDIEEGIC